MKRLKLTAVALPSLAPGEYTDHILPGLNLTVGVRRKTWTLRHRIGGKSAAIRSAISEHGPRRCARGGAPTERKG